MTETPENFRGQAGFTQHGLLCFFSGVLLSAALGLLVAAYWLPFHVMLSQDISFTRTPGTSDAKDWSWFLMDQRHRVERLAMLESSQLCSRITVYSTDVLKLRLVLEGISIGPDLVEHFQNLVHRYSHDSGNEAAEMSDVPAIQPNAQQADTPSQKRNPQVSAGGYQMQLPLPDWSRRERVSLLQWYSFGLIFIGGIVLTGLLTVLLNLKTHSIGAQLPLEDALQTPCDGENQTLNLSRSWARQYDLFSDLIEAMMSASSPLIVMVAPTAPAVCSPRPAVNIAIALSRRNYRVVLVDTSLGSDDIAEVFDFTDGPGFYDYLSGHAETETIEHTSRITNLSIITSGGVNRAAGEEVKMQTLETVSSCLKEIAAQYDLVLLYHRHQLIEKDSDSMASYTAALLAGSQGVLAAAPYRSHIILLRLQKKLRAFLKLHQTALLGVISVK